ncbi:protein obstructor-E-like isoform X2 [Vanessa cardui]|uniref:protein obstructor-E-like isoform X2 n=1 Tax=Vanessa cardui TaxID=171605 RepID=UPI001F140B38|nr:protein obstructor-E-like isoform X2 [Vanessa cardui]
MKTINVSFTCICLFAFVQARNINITSSPNSKVVIFIEEWIRETKELNELNLPSLISSGDKDFSNLSEVYEKLIKNIFHGHNENQEGHTLTNKNSEEENNYKVDIKENTTIVDRTDTVKLDNPTNQNETSQRTCTEKNERYPIPDSCDSYLECKNGIAERKLCPDGLRYKHNITSNPPCVYPADVQCNPGSTLQPPKPTEHCPNQNGYFKTVDRFNCSSYRICENGIGYEYKCPDGLAFSSSTYRCEWPDTVPQCDAEGLFDFRCPEKHHNSTNMNTPKSYRSRISCTTYFTCINGRPRRLECNELFGFDESKQTCVPAFKVLECSEHQRILARRNIKQNINGEYVVRDIIDDDNYFDTRAASISFFPRMKKPAIIN